MITSLPIDILPFIINNLHFKDIYNLFYVSKDIQKMYSSEFKGKYYHNYLIKLVNNNYEKFKNELHYVKDGLNELFIYSLQNIDTVWFNYEQGFHNMKYVYECMLRGCRINNDIRKQLNIRGYHFYDHFYKDLLNCMDDDRIVTQENIDNCKKLFSLHSTFRPYIKKYKKNDYY